MKKPTVRKQWTLKTRDGLYTTLSGITCALTSDPTKAQWWDERDNPILKRAFWQIQLGTQLEVYSKA